MKTSLTKLAGKAGYACKIYIRGVHVATVADPHKSTQAAALEAAKKWNRNYRKKLRYE